MRVRVYVCSSKEPRETGVLLVLKIRATDICPGNTEACVQHVASYKKATDINSIVENAERIFR